MHVVGGILKVKKTSLSFHIILYLEISLPTFGDGVLLNLSIISGLSCFHRSSIKVISDH